MRNYLLTYLLASFMLPLYAQQTQLVFFGEMGFSGNIDQPVKQISAGYNHTIALKRNGDIVVWGDNSQKQSWVPANLHNVKEVAAGVEFSVALKTDGTCVTWGSGRNIVPPAGLTQVKSIAAGGRHALALKADGTVVAWGENYNGSCDVPVGLAFVSRCLQKEIFQLL